MAPAWVGIGVSAATSSEAGARAFASPKSSTLTVPSRRTLMFAGFRSRWMMPCSCAASRASAICLAIDSASSIGIAPSREALRQILSLDEFHHERVDAVAILQPIDRADVGMIERGEHPRLAFEAGEPVGIVLERARQNFDRDLSAQPRVPRAVHFAHPTDAQQPLQLEDAEAPPGEQRAGGRDEVRRDVPWRGWQEIRPPTPAGPAATARRPARRHHPRTPRPAPPRARHSGRASIS